MKQRCPWASTDPLYILYHDHEWGVPVQATGMVNDHVRGGFRYKDRN